MRKVIGIVGEGPIDQMVLKAAINRITGERHIYRNIQPEQDMLGEFGNGWKGVYRWCETNADLIPALFSAMQANNPKDMMVDYAFMEKVEKYEKQGRDDVPEFMIHISKGNLRGVDHIHFVYSTDEVLYGAKQNFIDACKKYGVKYSVRERPGMIHCYAMLPYFRESKEDFEEIAQILAK